MVKISLRRFWNFFSRENDTKIDIYWTRNSREKNWSNRIPGEIFNFTYSLSIPLLVIFRHSEIIFPQPPPTLCLQGSNFYHNDTRHNHLINPLTHRTKFRFGNDEEERKKKKKEWFTFIVSFLLLDQSAISRVHFIRRRALSYT